MHITQYRLLQVMESKINSTFQAILDKKKEKENHIKYETNLSMYLSFNSISVRFS